MRCSPAGYPGWKRCLIALRPVTRTVAADAAFRLYDTFGLPRDFIEDMVEERALTLDRDGFDRAMQGQREKATRQEQAFGAATTEDSRDVVMGHSDLNGEESRQLPRMRFRWDMTSTHDRHHRFWAFSATDVCKSTGCGQRLVEGDEDTGRPR